jgi:hypothetical protein
VAALSLVALAQAAFILKTQFAPTDSAVERSIIASQLVAAATQTRAQDTSVPAAETTSPAAIGSSVATEDISGRLLIRSDPAGAKVLVDGRSQGVTPVSLTGVAPGSRRVVVSFAGRDVQQMVNVEAGSTASLIVPLTSAAEPRVHGRLSVVTPLEVDVFEGDALVGTSRMPELMLSPGTHTLRFVNDAFGYEDIHQLVVEAGKRVSIPLQVPQGELNVNALPWAEVSLDGNTIGETPLGNLKVTVGPHVVTFRHPELGEKTVPVAVKVGVPARVAADMRK